MRKVATIEVFIDDTVPDATECADTVIATVGMHEYVCDGTVSIKVKKEEE